MSSTSAQGAAVLLLHRRMAPIMSPGGWLPENPLSRTYPMPLSSSLDTTVS